jgi:hypothetical protein
VTLVKQPEVTAHLVPLGRIDRAKALLDAMRNGEISAVQALALFGEAGPLLDGVEVEAVEVEKP